MPIPLGEIASKIGAELRGDPDLPINGPATIETAEKGDITYISSSKFSKYLKSSKASGSIIKIMDHRFISDSFRTGT